MSKLTNTISYLMLIIGAGLWLVSCENESATDAAVASFEYDTTVEAFDTIAFTNTSLNASHYIWEFGDGGYSTLENPTHIYTEPGTYTVSLEAIGGESSDDVTAEIQVISDNVSLYEGVGIEGATIYETTWADLDETFGIDTITETYYMDSFGYYSIISYENKGIAFFLYQGSEAEVTDDAYVFIITVWGSYAGGTTEAGIGIGSTLSQMTAAYGEPDDQESYSTSYYDYTYYFYDSLGIDFLDFDEDYIYQIDIYYADDSTKSAHITKELAKEILHTNRKIIR